MSLRNVASGLSSVVLLGILCIFGYVFISFAAVPHNIGGMLSLAGFSIVLLAFGLFPPAASIGISTYTKNSVSQVFSSLASLLYGVWFAYGAYNVFYLHLDGLSVLWFVFAGIYFLPILLPLWTVAIVLNRYHAKKSELQFLDGESTNKEPGM